MSNQPPKLAGQILMSRTVPFGLDSPPVTSCLSPVTPITPHHTPCTPSQPPHNSVTPPLHPPKIPMTHPSDVRARSFPCRTCLATHLTTSERLSTTNVPTSERFRVAVDFDLAYISAQLLERCYPSVSAHARAYISARLRRSQLGCFMSLVTVSLVVYVWISSINTGCHGRAESA